MRILITEKQLKKILLSEQTKPKGPVYLTTGVLTQPILNKPEVYNGAVYAKDVFPEHTPGTYPTKISPQEIKFRHKKDGTRFKNELNQIVPGLFDPSTMTKTWDKSDYSAQSLQYSMGRGENPDLPEFEKIRIDNFKKKNPELQEPESNSKTSVTCKVGGRVIPAQNHSHYFDDKINNWVLKSKENIDKWRCTPAGFHPTEYAEYIKEKNLLGKPKTKKTSFGSTINDGEYNKKLEELNSKYKDKNFPFGKLKTDRDKFYKEREDIRKKTQSDIAKIARPEEFKKYDGYIAAMRTQAIQKRTNPIKELGDDAIKNLESQYGYWESKQEEEGFDFLTIVGFALYLTPYTAPFAPYFQGVVNLYDVANSVMKGNYELAAIQTLFALLPQTKIGQSAEDALSGLKALEKMYNRKLLNDAEKQGLAFLNQNAKTIKDELLQTSKNLYSKIPEKISGETQKWTEQLIKKAYGETEEQLSGLNKIKETLTQQAEKNSQNQKTT